MQNTSSEKFLPATELTRENLGEGIHRTVLGFDASLMLVKVEFEKGAVGIPHQHPHVQVSYIEKGFFEVEINGEKTTLNSGSSFYVAPNVLHGVVCLEEGILIDAFSPMRADFIQ